MTIPARVHIADLVHAITDLFERCRVDGRRIACRSGFRPRAAGRRCLRRKQAEHRGAIHRVLARAGVELGEQILQVPLDRLVADVHRLGDQLVRHPAVQKTEHFRLFRCQQTADRNDNPLAHRSLQVAGWARSTVLRAGFGGGNGACTRAPPESSSAGPADGCRSTDARDRPARRGFALRRARGGRSCCRARPAATARRTFTTNASRPRCRDAASASASLRCGRRHRDRGAQARRAPWLRQRASCTVVS